jgi:hypothetical protein
MLTKATDFMGVHLIRDILNLNCRFGPTEASILKVNFDGDAGIQCFKEHLNTVAKELILSGSLFDTEEECQDTKMIPPEDQNATCTSV